MKEYEDSEHKTIESNKDIVPGEGQCEESDIKTEDDIEPSPVSCSMCEKVEIICAQCGKIFLDENRLTRHVELWHETGEYNCMECGEKFILKEKLKNHTATKHGKQAESMEVACP